MRSALLVAIIAQSAAACSPKAADHAPALPVAKTSTPIADGPKQPEPAEDLSALFSRELDQMPPLVFVSGEGWSTKVPGRQVNVTAGTIEATEDLSFAFEDAAPTECTVFADPFDPATYLGNVLEELKKSLEVVGFTPTRFAVEKEIPSYFASVFYRKQTADGVLAGQLKLGLGLHQSRPVVCMHDVPGYSVSFESAARSLFANFRVANEDAPIAATIHVARVGTLPVGFNRESVRTLGNGRSECTSISAQVVPRSATEIMVSDEAEVIVVADSRIVEGHFIQRDLRGTRLDLTLSSREPNRYQVSGTLGSKPLKSAFDVKRGLPSAEATSRRLNQELERNRPFQFTQAEYHPALDPTNVIEVRYYRLKDDPPRVVRVGIGQLEMLTTVDEQGDQIRSEMKAGSQTIVIERMVHRDDRKKNVAARGTTRPKAQRP